jgi:hypothetical protein
MLFESFANKAVLRKALTDESRVCIIGIGN